MDQRQLEDHITYSSLFEDDGNQAAFNSNVGALDPATSIDNEVVDILKQRKDHRDKILEFLIHLTKDIVAIFVFILMAQIGFKVTMDIDVIPEIALNVIAVSMFVEVIATVKGITKALWNEKDIFSSPLIEKIRSQKNHNEIDHIPVDF